MGSKYSGNPGNHFIFAYPKQSDPKDVLKLRNEENRSVINGVVSADDVKDVHCYLLKQPAALDVEIDTSDETHSTASISWQCLKKQYKRRVKRKWTTIKLNKFKER